MNISDIVIGFITFINISAIVFIIAYHEGKRKREVRARIDCIYRKSRCDR